LSAAIGRTIRFCNKPTWRIDSASDAISDSGNSSRGFAAGGSIWPIGIRCASTAASAAAAFRFAGFFERTVPFPVPLCRPLLCVDCGQAASGVHTSRRRRPYQTGSAPGNQAKTGSQRPATDR